MAGNRFNRMPIANMMTNAKQAVEQELLKIDKVVTEEDMLDSNAQLTWFFE